MRLLAIILALFVFKAGIALPLTAMEVEIVQSQIELDDQNTDKSCCDHDDSSSEKNCCQTGVCCCISTGGITMTFQDLEYMIDSPMLINDSQFGYLFFYKERINNSVFQPPQLG